MSKRGIISNDDATVFLLPRIGAIVTAPDVPRITPSLVKPLDGGVMASWDTNNDFPQKVIEDVRKDPEIGTLLNKEAALLYSGGLIWGTLKKGNDGTETLLPLATNDELKVRDFMRKSAIKLYLIEAATDFYYFRNVFPEIVRSRDLSEIVQLCVQPAEACRWAKQDKNGIISTCFINPNFPEDTETSVRTKKLGVLDPYYDPVTSLALRKETNLIYPVSYPSPGSTYYQLADWNSIRLSGWLEISQAIPKFKKAMLDKQLTIKYHIEISDQYWPLKYKDWNSTKAPEQKRLKEAELKNFYDWLAGVEKAGNSLVTTFKSDLVSGKDFSMWKINVIDDKMKEGKYLEEGKDASLYKAMAIGLHPALVGNVPNSGLGGAGSNIREAYNLHMLMVKAHQDLILEPLYLVRDYNKWNAEIEFRFRNSFMNTLDKGADTTKTIA